MTDHHGSERDRFDPDQPNNFVDRRHERVYRGVMRSRQSKIPTWVYAVTLAVLVAAWIAWIIAG